jgi:hypothetical protein
VDHVLALLIPIVAVGGFFSWMISLSPVGKAFAERLRHGPPSATSEDRLAREELLEAVQALRQEVAELAERVDFTERLLARSSGDRAPSAGEVSR